MDHEKTGDITRELKNRLDRALAQDQPDYGRINWLLRALEGREDIPEVTDGEEAFAAYFHREPAVRANHHRVKLLSWLAVLVGMILLALLLGFGATKVPLPTSYYGKVEDGCFVFERPTCRTPNLEAAFPFESEDPTLLRLHEALTEQEISVTVPSWIPEGLELRELYTQPGPGGSVEVWFYLAGDRGTVLFAARRNGPEAVSPFFRTYTLVEGAPVLYDTTHMRYLVFRQEGLWEAVWATENCQYFLGTTSGEEDLYAMLDSMYPG